ncbi:YnbE family lipoprotein [Escherichia coli]|uniref:YnbE family lipoprotein n=1 Tax=Escherichia coli TaxID=562 RepID=UPI0010AC9C1C|nr:YnbE family lipoprotein [Escherichia coli]TJE30287.1 YnbE family lipoprotein [Escherichia coli]
MKILLAALTSSFMLAACTPRIEVAAPKEPITINMNVNARNATPFGGVGAKP